jgi:hypothetical protein
MLRISIVSVALLALFSVGCYSAPVMPPSGLIYTNIEAPVSPAVSGQPLGARRGEASSASILGLFAWGDASVKAATENGGIREPKHIDYNFYNVLGIYQSFTTIVLGD